MKHVYLLANGMSYLVVGPTWHEDVFIRQTEQAGDLAREVQRLRDLADHLEAVGAKHDQEEPGDG